MTARVPLVERLLDLAWSHWTALGVAGASSPSAVAVDLEALLLLTAELAVDDPRLRDESLDWCVRNCRFISKPRLKQLLKLAPPVTQSRFASFARALEEHAGGTWPSAERGERWPVRLSGKSQAPDLQRPALIRLRLRALFGVDARADLLAALLSFESQKFSAADLVFVGYTKRNIAPMCSTCWPPRVFFGQPAPAIA